MNLFARASVALGVIALGLLLAGDPINSAWFGVGGLVSGGIGWMASKSGHQGDYNWVVAGLLLSGLAVLILAVEIVIEIE